MVSPQPSKNKQLRVFAPAKNQIRLYCNYCLLVHYRLSTDPSTAVKKVLINAFDKVFLTIELHKPSN